MEVKQKMRRSIVWETRARSGASSREREQRLVSQIEQGHRHLPRSGRAATVLNTTP